MYNHKNKTSILARAFGTSGLKKLVLILKLYVLYPRKAVYNTMREITIKALGTGVIYNPMSPPYLKITTLRDCIRKFSCRLPSLEIHRCLA